MPWRFRSERTEDKKDKLLIHYCNGIFHVRETPVREFPIIRGIWFEKTGLVFLMGQFTSHRMNDIAKINHYAKYN